ncbi:MAG: LacI family DNA-binding transcriptional regulator [Actinomycetes bacterium]
MVKGPSQLRQVASRAGVSVATASAALRGVGRISPATVARVRAVAREQGYRGDDSAVGLGSSVAFILDLNVASGTGQAPALWWPRMLVAAMSELVSHGVVVCMVPADHAELAGSIEADAVVCFELPEGGAVIPESLPAETPCLVAGTVADDGRLVSHIAPSHEIPIRLAFDHLVKAGAKMPALVTSKSQLSYVTSSTDSYRSWCDRTGHDAVVIEVGPGVDLESELAAHFSNGVDAVYSLAGETEVMLDRIESTGWRVPDDVLFAAQSEGVLERLLQPSVTTVSYDGASVGKRIAQSLLVGIRTGRCVDVELHPRLAVRESTTRRH